MQCQTCILHNYTSMCFRHSPSDTTRFVPFRSVDHSLQPDLQHSSIVSIQRRTFLRTSNKHAEWQFLCNSVFVLFERRGSHCCAQNGQCCAQNGRTAVHRTGSVVQRTDSAVHRTVALLCTERTQCCAQNGHCSFPTVNLCFFCACLQEISIWQIRWQIFQLCHLFKGFIR